VNSQERKEKRVKEKIKKALMKNRRCKDYTHCLYGRAQHATSKVTMEGPVLLPEKVARVA
jgi:hypothetical protein